MPELGKTIAYVASAGDASALAGDAGLDRADIDEVIVAAGDEAFDALQDAVYAGQVGRIVLPTLALLGDDLMAQEMILADWMERKIAVFSRDEPDLGDSDPARRQARGLLGEIDEYGKIPWVP